MNLQIRLLLLALRTWSRLPLVSRLPDASSEHPAWLARSMRYAPLVGLAIALPASVVYVLAGLWLPHAVAVLACIGAGLALSGAIHERGVATFCEVRAEASDDTPGPRDVRPGQTAALCLAMLLLARFETLSSIDPSWIGVTLVCAAALSRGCAVVVLGTLPSAIAPSGAPASAAWATPAAVDAAVAAAWAVLPLIAAILWTGDAWVFAAAVAGCLVAGAAGRRIVAHGPAGYTRASFGTVQQLAELAFFVGMLATLSIADETPADSTP